MSARALEVVTGGQTKGPDASERLYEQLQKWGLKEGSIEPGHRGINISRKFWMGAKEIGAGSEVGRKGYTEDYVKMLEDAYGSKHPFLAAFATSNKDDPTLGDGKATKAVSKMTGQMEQKAAVDSSTVQSASPVQFDPAIIDVQRSAAPVLTRIEQQAQQGFTASYDIISGRSAPVGFVSESDAMDLSDDSESDATFANAQKDMKIWADQVNISDFAQRAESSLGFMDLEQTILGQRVKEHATNKAKAIFYGDPSVAETNGSVEDSNAYEGLAKIAVDAGNNVDKSTASVSGDKALFKDLKSELSSLVSDTGATYDSLEVLVSTDLFDALENEAMTNVRIDDFSGGVNFGGRQLNIKGVPVTECRNIRGFAANTTNFTPDVGDVFIIDRNAVKFRALAPLSTVPLGRVGLADKAALFEYGTLIDKSHGNHLRYLEGYPVN